MNSMVTYYCKAQKIPTFSLFNTAFGSGIPTNEVMKDTLVCFSKTGRIYTGFRHYPQFDLDLREVQSILLVRDPRDMLVSMYYSVTQSHIVPRKHQMFLKRRRAAASMTLDDFVVKKADEYLSNFHKYQKKLPTDMLTTYRYEDVIYSKGKWLLNLVEKLSLPVDRQLIKETVLKYDIFPEREDQSKHIRQVHPGNYKMRLKHETIDVLNEKLGEFLNFYGY